jgi:type IV fimbrial biogenesis protein FimT
MLVEQAVQSLHGQRGFSLIEACVVVALAGLLVSVAVPGFGALVERKRLEGSAQQLAADLHWLRNEALSRSEPLRLSLYPTADGLCTLLHSGQRSDCRCEANQAALCDGEAQALKTSHWPANLGPSVTANVSSMLFDPLQGTTTPAGSLRLTDSQGRSITLVVNILGRVRACSPAGSVPGYRSC